MKSGPDILICLPPCSQIVLYYYVYVFCESLVTHLTSDIRTVLPQFNDFDFESLQAARDHFATTRRLAALQFLT